METKSKRIQKGMGEEGEGAQEEGRVGLRGGRCKDIM